MSGPETVLQGSTGQYIATATYTDGSTKDVTPIWSIIIGGPGSIDSSGVYTAPVSVPSNTSVTIQASYSEDGITAAASREITVVFTGTTPALADLEITGPDEVAAGNKAGYLAIATYVDGSANVVTGSATWSVTSGPGSIDSSGVYTAPVSVTSDAPVTIHASYTENGTTKEASKEIIVTPNKRLVSISITDGPDNVAAGGTAKYTVIATYDDGSTKDVTPIWSVISGPGSIDSSGVYTAPASVTSDAPVTIHASYTENGIPEETTKEIIVTPTPDPKRLASISITDGPDKVAAGGTAKYTVIATYNDGSKKDVTPIWSVISGPGWIDSSGVYTAPALVSSDTPVTIHASYTEDGITREASKEITVVEEVQVSVPDTTGASSATVEIPVNVDNATGIAGFQFTITFDASVLQATDAKTGDLNSGWMITPNTTVAGEIKVVGLDISLQGLSSGNGSLLKLVFDVVGNAGQSTTLSFSKCKLSNNQAQDIPSTPNNGTFTIEQ